MGCPCCRYRIRSCVSLYSYETECISAYSRVFLDARIHSAVHRVERTTVLRRMSACTLWCNAKIGRHGAFRLDFLDSLHVVAPLQYLSHPSPPSTTPLIIPSLRKGWWALRTGTDPKSINQAAEQ